MRVALIAAALSVSACERTPVVDQSPAPRVPAIVEPPAQQAIPVEGWQSTHALVGSAAPDFSLQKVGGGTVSRDQLRGRWTILGFWNATLAGIEDEVRYLRALNSAVDQDPDLDLLTIHLKRDAAESDVAGWFANNGGDPWPTLIGEGETALPFQIIAPPAYLLIGPDLTIHAYRGALSADPDGIKSVIRGIAEIRKKIASPQ